VLVAGKLFFGPTNMGKGPKAVKTKINSTWLLEKNYLGPTNIYFLHYQNTIV
jgi:hypothetical protein